ncbi:MAG: electron transfer flavoprotein subunit beta/FixA family protein [Crocinitomicaceae bacterium]|nr:electron transfer flavoprotein subunit beta/FixA family protein [Crocinitomicaceae bacterium]
MKFLVCISKAPDTTTKIDFVDNNTKFNEAGVQYIVNPYDEWYALVRALELKETLGGTVTTVTVGTPEDEAIIRKALAIGADDSVRINADAKDAYYTAFQIADFAKKGGYDIVFVGKETINYNGSQVGGMIAEMMAVPFVSLASKLDLAGNTATIHKETTGGEEVIELNTPFVISSAKGMAEQRIPNMRGIMAARTKPLQVVEPAACDQLVSFVSYDLPKTKSACKFVSPDNIAELVNLLHTEAKVI